MRRAQREAVRRRKSDWGDNLEGWNSAPGNVTWLRGTFVRWTGWTLAVAVHCYDDSTLSWLLLLGYYYTFWTKCSIQNIQNP